MKDGRVLLIANPAAQRGNGAQAAQVAFELLSQWLGQDTVDFQLTQEPRHAVDLAAHASTQRYGTVIALGGDGMAHEVVNGLMRLPENERPCFGLIPVGSGNDYARTLGMAPYVPDAVVQFLDAQIQSFDVGLCNGVYFVETLSFGLDAAIALDTIERRRRTGKQGTPLYLASGLDQLLHHLDTFHMTAVLDGNRTIEGPVHQLAVQIGPTYGGGFHVCPQADPADGLFDLCYADAPMSVPAATFKFLRAKNGRHEKLKKIHFAQAASLEVTFNPQPPCQIDGEPLVADHWKITMKPRSLEVLTCKESAKRHT